MDHNYTLQQALEKMEFHKYSSIPILSDDGEYVGTVTEGDMLWYLFNNDIISKKSNLNQYLLEDVPRRNDYIPVNASSKMEDLVGKITQQNFVPVVDDCDRFIGIIKRRDVIQYYYNRT